MTPFNPIRLKLSSLPLGLALLCATSFNSSTMAQSQEAASRQIVLDEFMRARPAKSAETPAAVLIPKLEAGSVLRPL